MPPKQSTSSGSKPRGRPPSKANSKGSGGSTAKRGPGAGQTGRRDVVESAAEYDNEATATRDTQSSDVEMVESVNKDRSRDTAGFGSDEEEDQPKRIPPELLRRLLHEFFDKETTRLSKEANTAVARYFDIFVQEAIARTAAERNSRFLEVEDLEKVAPQLLLDL